MFYCSFYVTVLLIASFFREVSSDFQSAILAVHNEHRSNAGLAKLQWKASVAQSAQVYADTLKSSHSCDLIHSSTNYGENLYAVGTAAWSEDQLGTKAAEAWYSEISLYKYPDERSHWAECSQWDEVGHFSQMMWEDTTGIGCSFALCTSTAVVVCQYSPPGNFKGEAMFSDSNYDRLIESGEQMERCPGFESESEPEDVSVAATVNLLLVVSLTLMQVAVV